MDDAAIDADPIADGGKICRAGRLVTEPAADLHPTVSVTGDAVQPALLLDDAGHAQIAPLETRKLFFEKRTPAKAFALRHGDSSQRQVEDEEGGSAGI